MDKHECAVHCNCDGQGCYHAAWIKDGMLTHVLAFPSECPPIFLCGYVANDHGVACGKCSVSECRCGPEDQCTPCFLEMFLRTLRATETKELVKI